MLKAIDVQQVVMQMEQAEKVQRVEQQHPEMQQRYLELQAQEEKRLRQKKVPDAEGASKTLIGDRKERERRAGSDRRESAPPVSPEVEEQDGEALPLPGGHINIKI